MAIDIFLFWQMMTSWHENQEYSSQEPITRSVQLPYSLCETAFSQVSLFLDKPFPRIGFQ